MTYCYDLLLPQEVLRYSGNCAPLVFKIYTTQSSSTRIHTSHMIICIHLSCFATEVVFLFWSVCVYRTDLQKVKILDSQTQYQPGVGKMIPFTIPEFQIPYGTILGTVNEPQQYSIIFTAEPQYNIKCTVHVFGAVVIY